MDTRWQNGFWILSHSSEQELLEILLILQSLEEYPMLIGCEVFQEKEVPLM